MFPDPEAPLEQDESSPKAEPQPAEEGNGERPNPGDPGPDVPAPSTFTDPRCDPSLPPETRESPPEPGV